MLEQLQNLSFCKATWLFEIFTLALSLTGLGFLLKFALKKLPIYHHDFGEKEKVFEIFYKPCKLLFWVIGVFFSLEIAAKHFSYEGMAANIKMMRTSAIVVVFFWIILRWKKDFIARLSHKKRSIKDTVDVTMFHVLDRIFTIAFGIVTLLVILGIYGLNIAPLLTFGGVGAAAAGFAARDVISNFFGGMMLYITRPITVSDNIIIPDKKIEGTVEEIGWYMTCIKDKEKRPLYLPNSIFSSTYLVNASRMTHKKLDQTFSVQVSSWEQINNAVAKIQEYLQHHENIDKYLPIHVHLTKMRTSTAELAVTAYTLLTKDSEFFKFQDAVIQKVHEIVEKEGIVLSESVTNIAIAQPIVISKGF